MWNLWAKALGDKATQSDDDADKVAWIRTFLVIHAIVTNIFIISGVIRHW